MVKRGKAERAASAGARTAGSGIGAGIGTALSSPFGFGALAVVALLAGLFIFRDKISEAFAGGIGGVNVSLPAINLPEFKFPDFDFKFPDFDFKFPEIKFPDFSFPSLFPPTEKTPTTEGLVPDPETNGFKLPADKSLTEVVLGGLFPDKTVSDVGLIGPTLPPAEVDIVGGEVSPFATPIKTLVEQSMARLVIQESTKLPFGFEGGGPSFEGGTIFETPIENLSLNQIIERFNVTASQAADIRARASDDFGDFDFGVNTGQGIGSLFPQVFSIIGSPDINVSDPAFQGLTAQEIALRLTGGSISNF